MFEQHLATKAGGGGGVSSPARAIAHMNPKRAGVLLDFGTGTSFASFAELWNYLLHNGWSTAPGKAGDHPRMICVDSLFVVHSSLCLCHLHIKCLPPTPKPHAGTLSNCNRVLLPSASESVVVA